MQKLQSYLNQAECSLLREQIEARLFRAKEEMCEALMEPEPIEDAAKKCESSRQVAMQCMAFLILLDELQSGNQTTVGENIDPTPTEYITYERSNQA